MKPSLALLLTALALLAGCATRPPDVATDYSSVSGLRTDLMSENILETAQEPPREVVWLNASRVFKNYRNKDSKYYLEVNYMARTETGWLDIPLGNTLTLVADGQEMRFIGNGSFNKRKTPKKGFVSEAALYEVTRPQLQQIADAKEIKARIKGDNGLVERDFAPDNFRRFREFLLVTRH